MADYDGSRSERYLLITLDLPDGSGGTADPDATTDLLAQVVRQALTLESMRRHQTGESGFAYTVEDAYYGDIVGDWDPEDDS